MELKGKVIEFAGRDYFVVDQFMYNDKEYLYIIQAKVQEKMDVYFLIKDKEGKYEAINDEEIFNELTLVETKRMMENGFPIQ
ncbi:MAG: hypothetical protein ACLUF5_06745 [Clostridia bacterium]|jgi:hypothetical protein